MPELPEVETTRRGIAPHVSGRRVAAVELRRADLRWPIATELSTLLPGQAVQAVRRRAKYLLLDSEPGSVLVHLGMSGSLRVLREPKAPNTHDHADFVLDDGVRLRFTDPRRFGCLLWQPAGAVHPLLAGLGPEPLDAAFDADYLYRVSRGRSASIKTVLMDQRIVVGVGNIYAAESLFRAGIDPRSKAGRVSRERLVRLVDAVKAILGHAIERGGTTLRDFLNPDGAPGYFEQALFAYGREGQPCKVCGTLMRGLRLGQRATAYCPKCQK